jgi:hypothetical protein
LVGLMAPQPVQAGGDLGENLRNRREASRQEALPDRPRVLPEGAEAERAESRADYGMGLVYEATGKVEDALTQYWRFVDLAQTDSLRDDKAKAEYTKAKRRY